MNAYFLLIILLYVDPFDTGVAVDMISALNGSFSQQIQLISSNKTNTIKIEFLDNDTFLTIPINNTEYALLDNDFKNENNINIDHINSLHSLTQIKKCCGLGQVFSSSDTKCISNDVEDIITIFKSEIITMNGSNSIINVPPHSDQKCADYEQVTDGNFSADSVGSCLELMTKSMSNLSSLVTIRCKHMVEGRNGFTVQQLNYYLQVGGCIATLICLVFVLMFYIAIPELRDIPGQCIMNFVVSKAMMFGFIVLTIFNSKDELGWTACFSVGVLMHFSILATFFWLNILCFDIFWIIRMSIQGLRTLGGKTRLILYLLYGWGSPTIIIIVSNVINLYSESELPSYIMRPAYAEFNCFVPKEVRGAYVHGVSLVPYCMGIGFLLGAYIYINNAKKQAIATSRDSSSFNNTFFKQFRNRFSIFIFMTLCWVTEFLSGHFFVRSPFWIVSDFINASQGIILLYLSLHNKKKRVAISNVFKKCWSRTIGEQNSQNSKDQSNFYKSTKFLSSMSTSKTTSTTDSSVNYA